MNDVDELNAHRRDARNNNGGEGGVLTDVEEEVYAESTPLWEPSGSWWKDFLYFSGPGEQALMQICCYNARLLHEIYPSMANIK